LLSRAVFRTTEVWELKTFALLVCLGICDILIFASRFFKIPLIFGLSISHSIDKFHATDPLFCFPMQLELAFDPKQ
jgi:hypothetical protein